MLGSGIHCSVSCISLPGEVHDTLGGRQGLMSTTQGCTSLHRCSESVYTHTHNLHAPARKLASWPAGRSAAPAGRSVGWPADWPVSGRLIGGLAGWLAGGAWCKVFWAGGGFFSGWQKLFVPTCPFQAGTKSFLPSSGCSSCHTHTYTLTQFAAHRFT